MKARKYLLDTHIILWFLENNANLSDRVDDILTNHADEIVVSIISLWEIAIKLTIGKLHTELTIEVIIECIKQYWYLESFIDQEVIINYTILPLYHRDPFDRLMIAFAKSNNLTIISNDNQFPQYDVKLFSC